MKGTNFLFTSESVTEGHPDKVADQISDNILDEIFKQDPKSRVACETLVTTGMAMISGEITTSAYVHMPEVVRQTIRDIGYKNSSMGFDWETCAVLSTIDKQSPDIAMGVDGDGAVQGTGRRAIRASCSAMPALTRYPPSDAHAHLSGPRADPATHPCAQVRKASLASAGRKEPGHGGV